MQVNGQLTAADIDIMRSWKVNVVRYPLVWGDTTKLDASDATTYAAWLSSAMDQLDNQIPIYKAAGIKLIVNLYSPPGGFSRRDSKATHRIFQNAWAQDAFLSAWEKLAARYASNPTVIAFDLLNEPALYGKPSANLLDWNKLAVKAGAIIRAQNKNITIVMSPMYGKTTTVAKLKKLPYKNVVYTIHFYQPWRFVHQKIFNNTTYKYPDSFWNRRRLESNLKPIINFQKKYKARIYIGEFSVARWAPKASSTAYLNDVMFLFDKYKFDWTYHAFREADVWSLEFAEDKNIRTAAMAPTARLKIIKRYLAKNKHL